MIISLVITLVTLGVSAYLFKTIFLPMINNANSLMGSLAQDAQRRAQLMAHGAEGVGRILGLRETGTLVNHQPQVVLDLEVMSAQGQRFNAQCTALVSPMSAPRVQPGCTVPVRYNPANVADVAVVI